VEQLTVSDVSDRNGTFCTYWYGRHRSRTLKTFEDFFTTRLLETLTPSESAVSIFTVGSLTPVSTETAAATKFGFGVDTMIVLTAAKLAFLRLGGSVSKKKRN